MCFPRHRATTRRANSVGSSSPRSHSATIWAISETNSSACPGLSIPCPCFVKVIIPVKEGQWAPSNCGGKTRYDRGMGTPIWVTIALAGLGAVMTTLGKRWVRAIGIALIAVAAVVGATGYYRTADGQSPIINGNCNTYGPNGTISGSCNTTIVSPPHDKHSLYQGDQKIGQVQGQPAVDEQNSTAAFAQITFNVHPDPSAPFEYGRLLLNCDKFPRLKPGEIPAPIFLDLEINVQCRIIGKQ